MARRYGQDVVRGLVTAAARAWEPPWATFADSLRETGRGETGRGRPVGFLTWTPDPPEPVLADLPELGREEDAGGSLLTRPDGWRPFPAPS
ncbi:hypothetical protein [Streptomyces sp. NPDC016675]|uniref:hypothetical protein n=1 Tax=Streptomyces sp. NPDC016675 TaxID=3364970 RepID=UPI0036FA4888